VADGAEVLFITNISLRSDGIGWITVRSPSFVDEGLGDTEGLQDAWKELTDSSDTIDFQTVKKLALKYR
jgi:hypothetical protein